VRFFITFLFLTFVAVTPLAAQKTGIAWEFNQNDDFEGWQFVSTVENPRVRDGSLKAIAAATTAQLVGPVMQLNAREYGMLQIRMRVDGPQSAVVYWVGDSTLVGYESFPVVGDGLFHEYSIRMYKRLTWRGQIQQITRITTLARIGTEIEIDYIRILRVGVTGNMLDFKPLRTVLKPGELIPWTGIIANAGDEPGNLRSVLHLPAEFQLLQGSTEADHGILAPEETDTLIWNFRCDQPGEYEIKISMFAPIDTSEFIYPAKVVEKYWQQEEFLLSAWSPPYAWYPPPYDEQVFENYCETNFENILWVAPTDEAMAMVEKYNLKCLLLVSNFVGGDEYLRANNNLLPPTITAEMLANLDPIIEKYRNHPNVIGYFIIDEPKMPAFANCGKVVAYLREKDPTRLGYINIFPGEDAKYNLYVDTFMDVVKPELLGYDRYVFFNGYDGNEFFGNLATIRTRALRYGIPFCNIIQAIGTKEFNLNWRTPNAAEHRWLVYHSLAYGAQALIWFHWHADWGVTGSPDSEQIYASLQQVNSEINQLGPHLLPLHSVGAYHCGAVPPGGQPLPNDAWIKPESPAAQLVIGCFKDDADRDWVMVTNVSYRDSVIVRMHLNRKINELRHFDIAAGNWVNTNYEIIPEGIAFDVPLRAGGGTLFEVGETAAVAPQPWNLQSGSSELFQNYPNPFNPVTHIRYVLPVAARVTLIIYNLQGAIVKTLVSSHQSAGLQEVIWDARDDAGVPVSSGIYFYKLRVRGQTLTRKLLLMK